MKRLEPTDWARIVRPGSRVFVGSGAGAPLRLMESFLRQSEKLRDVELVHIHTLGPTPWVEPRFEGVLRTNTFFLTPEVAAAVREGRADYTPASMSEVGRLFESTALPIDVALVSVAPQDGQGRFSYGVSVDVVAAAVRAARVVVAQVNRQMPRSHGTPGLRADRIDYFIEVDEPLPNWLVEPMEDDLVRQRIGGYLAQLVEEGGTLQVGLGETPQAVVGALRGHRRLGIHSGMISEAMRELIEAGAVDNSRKGFMEGWSVASHALGGARLYDFVAQERGLRLLESGWVNDPAIIARHRRMTAINGARQIDLTGQIVRDSTGSSFHGGVGAQIDFLRGSAASVEGRPIWVMPSTDGNGTRSRIVADFASGTQVATARSDTHWVITEFGIANLHGKSIRERALSMIGIADPRHREELLRGAHARGWLPKMVATAPTSLRPGEGNGGVEVRRVEFDGRRFLLRPLHPVDMRRLQRFFYSHSEQTIRLRYGYARESMPVDRAYELVGVDQSRDLALALFEETGAANEEVICAIGRFYREEDGAGETGAWGEVGGRAEVAFVVGESVRRRGVASRLLVELARIAQARGITALTAEVLRENRPMRALFEKFGGRRVPSELIEGDAFVMEVKEVLERGRAWAVERSQRAQNAAESGAAELSGVRTGWFWDAACLRHETGPGHPEGQERYRQLGEGLQQLARQLALPRLEGRAATQEELLRVHSANYLDLVHIDVEQLADQLRTGDTMIGEESESVARWAAGSAMQAVDEVMSGRIERAFVAIRPPGHHATAERGMGFCIYNHVALMARHAQAKHGVQRVLIVDWDVHHGNGTEEIFAADPSVWYFSSHQQGIYPGTGAASDRGVGAGLGSTLNLPLSAGADAAAVMEALRGPVAAAMAEFRPELILISAGFDASVDDPLGGLAFADEDFMELTRILRGFADRWAQGRMLSVLEGGYSPQALRRCAVAHLRALAE